MSEQAELELVMAENEKPHQTFGVGREARKKEQSGELCKGADPVACMGRACAGPGVTAC